jgi:hypothetical protein
VGISENESGGMVKPTLSAHIKSGGTYLILKWRSGHSIPTLPVPTIDWRTGRNRNWNTNRDGICNGNRNSSRDWIWHSHTHSHAEVDGHTHTHSHSAVDHWVVVDHGMEV